MKYKLCKLEFTSSVHFGNGNLADCGYTIYADTFFSALCQEALKYNRLLQEDGLLRYGKSGTLWFSDLLPYMKDTLYMPKPVTQKKIYKGKAENYHFEKMIRKQKYLPYKLVNKYYYGKVEQEEFIKIISDFENLGTKRVRTQAAIFDTEDAMPYYVGEFQYADGNGIYFIMAYDEKNTQIEPLIVQLVESLGIIGIGGKTSIGHGKFIPHWEEINTEFASHLCIGKEEFIGDKKLMTISVSLPTDEELTAITKDNNAVLLENAQYEIIKRSGFVSSINYSEEKHPAGSALRKRDLYVFAAGAIFESTFSGELRNVSNKGCHEVLRYTKPMFWRLEDE